MSYDAPQSRNEAILQNILGANNVLVDPQSRIEAILQAILYDEIYDEEAMSRMEELLLAIKNNGTWNHEPISRNEEILYAKLNGETYDKEPQSRIEALLIDWCNQSPITVVTDIAPYLFRQSGGDNNAYVGTEETDTLIGASAVVNQTFNYDGGIGKNNGTIEVSNNSLTFTATNKSAYQYINQPQVFLAGHKVLVSIDVTLSENETVGFGYGGGIGHLTSCTANTKKHIEYIDNFANNANIIYLYLARTAGLSVGATAIIDNFSITDLTAMFGTAIADYVYSLEQATAGSGIAYLRKYGFFTKDYYPYTANTLQSVNTSKHIMVGRNLFDKTAISDNKRLTTTTGQEEGANNYCVSDYIYVRANFTYYIANPQSARCWFYDVNKNPTIYDFLGTSRTFTPTTDGYIRVTIYKALVNVDTYQINIGSAAVPYEPYSKHEYALPNIDLRGLYKLDASNNLYADGDTLEGDGTLTRKYGIVDFGTLNWSYQSANSRWITSSLKDLIKRDSNIIPAICSTYVSVQYSNTIPQGTIAYYSSNANIFVNNGSEDITPSGYLIYELATPTTEQVTGFTNPQIVDKYGTEEYTDERDFPLPVGHETDYPSR